jgi:hypothetical protein
MLTVNHSFAQEPKNNTPCFWLNGGFGLKIPDDDFVLLTGLNLSAQIQNSIISARYCPNQGGFDVTYKWKELAVLYGGIKKAKYGYVSASIGPAYMNGQIKDVKMPRFGIAAETQLFFTALPVIGIGLTGLGNVNTKMSYFGVMLCLQVGKLR